MEILHTLFFFVIILSIIVFIHEFGHYIVAKWCGVKVEEFAIGFGKEIGGFNDRSGTRWKFCMLPLGGYVKMFGDATEASTTDAEAMDEMSEEDKALTFHHKPLWKKSLIVFAGPAANFILTIGIFTYFTFTNGLTTTAPVIGEILPNTPAAESGLQAGDRVLTVDGEEVNYFREIPLKIAINIGEPVALRVEREGEIIAFDITPRVTEQEDALGNTIERPLIGFKSQQIKFEDIGLMSALGESTRQTYDITVLSLQYIGQIITGQRNAKELKGPVGIAQLSGQAAERGFFTVLWFIAMISANLGMVNLLPIPPLDGGHLMFYAIEGASRRTVAERFKEYSFRAGFALLMMLMAFTVYNDIRNIIVS